MPAGKRSTMNIPSDYLIQSVAVGMMILMMAVGYIAGRLTRIERLCQNDTPHYKPLQSKNTVRRYEEPDEAQSKIQIDDRKFVIDVNTSGIEKKYGELGETKVSDENISSSVNKLKGMKK
jgi:hypothetical protein